MITVMQIIATTPKTIRAIHGAVSQAVVAPATWPTFFFRQPAVARLLTPRVATVRAGVSPVGDTVLALGAVDKAHRPLMGGDSEGETERVQASAATEHKKRGL